MFLVYRFVPVVDAFVRLPFAWQRLKSRRKPVDFSLGRAMFCATSSRGIGKARNRATAVGAWYEDFGFSWIRTDLHTAAAGAVGGAGGQGNGGLAARSRP